MIDEFTKSYPFLSEPIALTKQDWDKEIEPMVSIVNNTYNHEGFIRDAIDGFLMQETTFKVEILVHDDASTDRTADIIKDYEAKHPNLIKPIYQTNNQFSQGIKPGPAYQFPRARGKYIALCEGDDYWTDPLKLQKQVEFLEGNEEYVACFHKVKIKKTDGLLVDDFITNVPENHESILNLAKFGNYIHTPSVVFRNLTENYPKEFYKSPIGDYPMYMYLSQSGRVKYFEEVMAVYRHGVGIWSNHDQYFRRYNTAISHAILFEYFMSKENSDIAIVFANRILNFLMMNTEAMPNEDFDNLLKYPALGRIIIRQQFLDSSKLKPQLIKNATIRTLFKALLKKMKSRIVK